jgi:SAM-dependent methyltransferase
MDESARARTRTDTEVATIDHGDGQATHRRVPEDASAGDAATDDEQVVVLCHEGGQRRPHGGKHLLGQRHSNPAETTAPGRPSTWLVWHGHLVTRGAKVLDLACGTGRHSLAAAMLGGEVTAVDHDPDVLGVGREAAKSLGLSVSWVEWDLSNGLPPVGTFDVLLMFNYLDRSRVPELIEHLRPGGHLIMETFLEDQRAFDWGPTNPDHLLKRGELPLLIAPLEVIYGREVLEPVGGVQWSAMASVVARKVP